MPKVKKSQDKPVKQEKTNTNIKKEEANSAIKQKKTDPKEKQDKKKQPKQTKKDSPTDDSLEESYEPKKLTPEELNEEIERHMLSLFYNLLIIQDPDDIKRTLSKDAVFHDEIMNTTVNVDYNIADYLSSFYRYINDKKVLVECHVIEKNFLHIRFKKLDGSRIYLVFEAETRMEKVTRRREIVDALKIYKLSMRRSDKRAFASEKKNKEYSFRSHDDPSDMKPTTLEPYDSEKEIENEKGILYAVLFKFFKKWLVNEDMNQLRTMITDDCVLIDKEIIMTYEGKSDVISHLYSFITAFFSQEAVVLKYTILGGDLYIRMYKEKDDISSDVLVASTIRGAQLCKLVMCVPERDAFMDPPKTPSDKIRDPVADLKQLAAGAKSVRELFNDDGTDTKLIKEVKKSQKSKTHKTKKVGLNSDITDTTDSPLSDEPKQKQKSSVKKQKKIVETSSESEKKPVKSKATTKTTTKEIKSIKKSGSQNGKKGN
jgi:hypothetical protein